MADDLTSVTASCTLPHPVLPPKADLDDETAAIAQRSGQHDFYGQFGHAPEVIHGWMRWYFPMMTAGRVELRTKELARLRVAARNGCHY